MRLGLRRVLGIASALAATAATGALSRVPYTAESSDSALVRLSWRATGELVEECREPTPEELERLPAHMRKPEICQGRMAPYRLRMALDGRPLVDELLHAAGAREDRPIYVFRDLAVPPGTYRLDVAFERVVGEKGAPGHRDARPEEERRTEDLEEEEEEEEGKEEAVPLAQEEGAEDLEEEEEEEGTNVTPPRLHLQALVPLHSRHIALVTYDPELRKLVLVSGGPAPR